MTAAILRPEGKAVLRAAGVWTMEPGAAYLPDAAVAVQDGHVVAVGPAREILAAGHGPVQDLRPAVLVPGLVNAHVHLGLSHALGRVSLGQGFTPWLRSLVPLLREIPSPEILAHAVTQVADCGTAMVADLATPHVAKVLDALHPRGITVLVFAEFLGYARRPADALHPWLAEVAEHPAVAALARFGHAPYTTHPQTLQAQHRLSVEEGRVFGLHLAECPEEVELLEQGSGSLADLLRAAGILPKDFSAPGLRPVPYAHELGLLGPGTLAVHCVQVNEAEVPTLAASGTTVCLCPRSNALIGVGRAPWEAYLEAGMDLCLATDGLSSNRDLDLWNELRALLAGCRRRIDPEAALAMLTRTPARILGLSDRFGRIAPGMAAHFAVLPPDLADLADMP